MLIRNASCKNNFFESNTNKDALNITAAPLSNTCNPLGSHRKLNDDKNNV